MIEVDKMNKGYIIARTYLLLGFYTINLKDAGLAVKVRDIL